MKGGLGNDARVAKFCEDLLTLECALRTFVKHEGVEPTNNLNELGTDEVPVLNC